jgi:hypothetical protein
MLCLSAITTLRKLLQKRCMWRTVFEREFIVVVAVFSILQRTNSSSFRDLTDKVAAGQGYGLEGGGYEDGDDGQMTWFNTGVRVGVGLGLGMCLGVGIGVGLIARTFHATSRTLRKGFI